MSHCLSMHSFEILNVSVMLSCAWIAHQSSHKKYRVYSRLINRNFSPKYFIFLDPKALTGMSHSRTMHSFRILNVLGFQSCVEWGCVPSHFKAIHLFVTQTKNFVAKILILLSIKAFNTINRKISLTKNSQFWKAGACRIPKLCIDWLLDQSIKSYWISKLIPTSYGKCGSI